MVLQSDAPATPKAQMKQAAAIVKQIFFFIWRNHPSF
jgi:hypothetical protein